MNAVFAAGLGDGFAAAVGLGDGLTTAPGPGDVADGGFGAAVGLGAGLEQASADVTSNDINTRTISSDLMNFPRSIEISTFLSFILPFTGIFNDKSLESGE